MQLQLAAACAALGVALLAGFEARAQSAMYNVNPANPPRIRALTPDERTEFLSLLKDAEARFAAADPNGAADDEAKMIAILSATWGPAHPALAAELSSEAFYLGAAGRYQEAFAAHDRSMALVRKYYGERSLEYADELEDVGRLDRMVYADEKGIDSLNQALALEESILARNRGLLADNVVRVLYEDTLFNLGGLYHDSGDDREAIGWMQKLSDFARSVGDATEYRAASGELQNFQKRLAAREAATTIMAAAPFGYNERVTGKVRDMTIREVDQLTPMIAHMEELKSGRDIEKSEAFFNGIVDFLSHSLGPNDPIALQASLGLEVEAGFAGASDEAERIAEANDERIERIYGPDSLEYAAALYQHGNALFGHMQGAACGYFRRALAVSDRLKGTGFAGSLDVLDSAALCELSLGDQQAASDLYARELGLRRARFGEKDPQAPAIMARVGFLQTRQGDFAEAEATLTAARKGIVASKGQDSEEAAEADYYLGTYYADLGRPAQAEPLLEQSFRIRSAKLGMEDDRTIETLLAVTDLYDAEGLAAKGQPLLQSVINSEQRALGNPKAGYLERWEAAQALFKAYDGSGQPQAVDALINQHPELFQSAGQGGELGDQVRLESAAFALQSGHADQACALLGPPPAAADAAKPMALARTSMTVYCSDAAGGAARVTTVAANLETSVEQLYGADNPNTVGALALLALTDAKAGDWTQALAASRKAAAIERRLGAAPATLSSRTSLQDALTRARSGQGIAPTAANVFTQLVEIAAQVPGGTGGGPVGDEAFQAAQDASVTTTSKAMLEALARARGTDAQANLARQYQDEVAQLQSLDVRLSRALADGASSDVAQLRRQIDQLGASLAQSERELAVTFPAYGALVHPTALSVAQVRTGLAPDEALVLLLPEGRDTGARTGQAKNADLTLGRDAMFVFVVTKTGFAWKRVDGAAQRTHDGVQTILCDVDAADCQGAAAPRDETSFDFAAAHQLYLDTIGAVAPELQGVRRIYVSAVGDAARIPLSLLVTSDPSSSDLTTAAWLGDRYAITVLPSTPALALAHAPAPGAGGKAVFVGYGDPSLSIQLKPVVRSAEAGGGWFLPSSDGGTFLADPAKLRTLPSLPGTAQELKQVAGALDAADVDRAVHIEARDDEGQFKSDGDLGAATVVEIATHALFPASGPGDPGLVFTPPATPTAEDDGLLTSSEILRLRLAADWVILSACDTAAAEQGAEQLSGLSKAFLFAGAHSLLASYWRVADQPTAALVTDTLKRYAGGGLSKSQALQAAMQALRQDARFRHPRYWAAFALISSEDR